MHSRATLSKYVLSCSLRIVWGDVNVSFDVLLQKSNRWLNHGKPPGANVAAIADGATIRPEVVFTIRFSVSVSILVI